MARCGGVVDVLIDSSVWIAADRPRTKEHRTLIELIRGTEHRVCVCAPIRAEVCQGAREQAQFEALWSGFQGFIDLPIREDHWEQCAWNYFRCRKRGMTLSTIDCLIATLASTYRVPLWTVDKAFKMMREVVAFEVFEPRSVG